MDGILEYLGSLSIAENTWVDLTKAALLFLSVYLGIYIIKRFLLHRVKTLLNKANTHWDDSIIEAVEKFFSGFNNFIIALYIANSAVQINPWLTNVIGKVFIISITLYAILSSQIFLRHIIAIIMSRFNESDEEDTTMIGLMYNIARVLLWTAGVLMILQNLGYEVTALLGGIGIAGIAISFAVKDILSDIFAYFTIHLDKPFRVGDFVAIGTDKGTVEHIGLKSTRLQTPLGDQLVISNAELTSTRLNNFKLMERRRMLFTIGVTYDTPATKLKKIPSIIKKLITEEKYADFDRAHFTEYLDSSLLFEIVYFMNDSDFKKAKDTQQRINIEIKKAFEKEKIEFAFPTQTIYVAKEE